VVVLNPQWQGEGQVISDFGFGRARRDAEDFVESFQPTFCFRNLRLMGQVSRACPPLVHNDIIYCLFVCLLMVYITMFTITAHVFYTAFQLVIVLINLSSMK
jgi:hypothetical protein